MTSQSVRQSHSTGVLLRCALSPATLALRYGIPYRSKCILPNLPFMELTIKALNWLLDPKIGGLQVFRERGRIGREGVRMGGDRKDSNPFLAKRPTPVSGGGGEGWVSMVTYLQFRHRGGYSLYHLWIYFIEIWLSIPWTLPLPLLTRINKLTWGGGLAPPKL